MCRHFLLSIPALSRENVGNKHLDADKFKL